jgi:hypothetical protein
MRKRISIAFAALAAAAIPTIVAAATTAYTSPTLRVSQAGATTTISASSAPTDDSTARAAIYVPTGTAITAGQAPGTPLGTVKAQVSALALGGALLPLTGPIVVAPPGAVPAATQLACTGGETPTATWILQLEAAGQQIALPAFLIPTAAAETALGAAKLVFCLPPPDVPVDQGGATFGAKFLSAELAVKGVFGVVQTGAWIAMWTPYLPGGAVNAAGTVASPAAVAPGAVGAKAKKNGRGAIVSGKVTQAGQGRGNASVQIWGRTGKGKLTRRATVKAKANGAFAVRIKVGDVFQVRVVAAPTAAPPLCAALVGLPAPCVNPTVNGFAAQTKAFRKK